MFAQQALDPPPNRTTIPSAAMNSSVATAGSDPDPNATGISDRMRVRSHAHRGAESSLRDLKAKGNRANPCSPQDVLARRSDHRRITRRRYVVLDLWFGEDEA